MRTDRLPMLLSATRVALAPCFAVALHACDQAGDRATGAAVDPVHLVPLAIALLAAATDWADGRLARRLGVASSAGASLDVAADAAFVLGGLVALATAGIVVPALPVAAALALAAFAASRLLSRSEDRAGDDASAPTRPRSPADALGHAAGVLNYAIVIAGASLPLFPRAAGWVRVASALVAVLNVSPVALRAARSRRATGGTQASRGSSPEGPPPRDRA